MHLYAWTSGMDRRPFEGRHLVRIASISEFLTITALQYTVWAVFQCCATAHAMLQPSYQTPIKQECLPTGYTGFSILSLPSYYAVYFICSSYYHYYMQYTRHSTA